jgi:hypothetical protein
VSDDRTPEQRAADEALDTAIENAVRAYGALHPSTVITNWIVVGTGLGADGEGELYPDFILLPNNGEGLSHVVLIGILRAASLRAEASYLDPD